MVLRENDIWRVIVSLLRGWAAAEHPALEVKRLYQRQTQGAGDTPLLALHRIGGRKVGALGKHERLEDGRLIQTLTWKRELTVQAGAFVEQSTDEAALTGADILEGLSVFLHSDEALATLKKHGIGILAITELREFPFRDETEQWAISASFDFTLTFTQAAKREVHAVQSAEFKTHRLN